MAARLPAAIAAVSTSAIVPRIEHAYEQVVTAR
jgi:hypothetical protein